MIIKKSRHLLLAIIPAVSPSSSTACSIFACCYSSSSNRSRLQENKHDVE